MPRELTTNERAVLGHVVLDPDAWWEHANSIEKVNAEGALANKVSKWQASHDAASNKVRTSRPNSEPALGPTRLVDPCVEAA